eukprot:gene9436-4768_t
MEATAVKAIVEVFGAAAIVEGAELVFISIRYGGSLVGVFAAAIGGEHSKPKAWCAPEDDAGDCAALKALAMATAYTGWTKNTKWGESKTVCDWHGITCSDVKTRAVEGSSNMTHSEKKKKHARVIGIDLKDNNLVGYIPTEIGQLTELRNFSIQGGRPANYHGCDGSNLKNSTLPESFYTMSKLIDVNLEYTCI